MRLVISGGVYIPAQALPGQEQAPSAPSGMPQAAGARPVSDQRPISPADLGLTERQMDVLTLIMQGKNNKAICQVLDLSEPTVKSHVSAILRALKLSNRTEIVVAVNRKRPGDGDIPEAPLPTVPPSSTKGLGPQGESVQIVPEEP